MKFKQNAPRILIISSVLVICITMLLTAYLFSGLISATEEKQFSLMRSILSISLSTSEDRALSTAEVVANSPHVRDLFAKRNRAGLLKETIDMYGVQHEKYGLSTSQFNIPPSNSFLRLHAPDKYGDDLSDYRPMVVSVLKEQTPIRGIALTRVGPGIFAVVPVKDPSGKFTGSFEIGLDFGPVLDSIKTNYGFDSTLLIDEEILSKVSTRLKGDVFNKDNRVGKYLRFYTTNTDLMKELIEDKDLKINDEKKYVRETNSKHYGLVLMPIKIYTGETIGVIAIANDFSGSRSDALQIWVWQILMALFGIILLYGMIKIVLKGLILRPLEVINKHFNSLISGNSNETIVDSDHFCEEIQGLVKVYEKIRSKDNLKL